MSTPQVQIKFEDRVIQALRHLPESDHDRVQYAIETLGSEPLPDVEELADGSGVHILRASPELRVLFRYERDGPRLGIVIEDIVSRSVLSKFFEPAAR